MRGVVIEDQVPFERGNEHRCAVPRVVVREPPDVAQAQREIRALRDYLQHADTDLCRRTQLWIDGFIVFAHPRASVDARYSPVPALSPDAAVARIRATVPRRRLSLADQQRVVALLESVQPDGLAGEAAGLDSNVMQH